ARRRRPDAGVARGLRRAEPGAAEARRGAAGAVRRRPGEAQRPGEKDGRAQRLGAARSGGEEAVEQAGDPVAADWESAEFLVDYQSAATGWPTCSEPEEMFLILRGRVRAWKVGLFACGWRIRHLETESWCRAAWETSERYAGLSYVRNHRLSAARGAPRSPGPT